MFDNASLFLCVLLLLLLFFHHHLPHQVVRSSSVEAMAALLTAVSPAPGTGLAHGSRWVRVC